MCFSFCILRVDQQSSEYLQISLIQDLWSIQLSIPFVWHVLDAKCLPPHQAVPELPASPYIHNRSCDIPICRRTFPLSSSLSVPQAELQGLSEAKLVQMQSLWRVFASGGTNDFEAWGPVPRWEDFVAMFQVSIPPKALGLERNILRGERLQDSSIPLMLFRGDLCKRIGSWKQHGCTVPLWFCFFPRKLNNC